MILNVGCGTHYATGWVNTDTREAPDTHPDILTVQGEPWPFADDAATRIFLSHVLEHVPWRYVPTFIAEARRVLTADGTIVVVGPDVHKAIECYKAGSQPFSLVASCLEQDPAYVDSGVLDVSGGRHEWCCEANRVVAAFSHCGFDAVELAPDAPELDGWPVVSREAWQFFVRARPRLG